MVPSCPDAAALQGLLDGTVAETVQAGLSQHLENCASCRAALDKLATDGRSLLGLARDLHPTPTPAEPGLQRVLDAAGGAVSDETQAEPRDDNNGDLAFLTPSSRPGMLGRLGHYDIQAIIGRGGFGIVLKAFDEHLHRVVAIKVLAPQIASSGTARKRFTREARAAASIAHEHVVTIHAVAEDHNPPYIVMHYIAGMSLQEKLDQMGPLGLKEILRIGLQTAEGLAAAHKQGLVHRDVKPANILLENGVERVRITDFGLARAVDDASLTQSGVVAGTPMYMSPEQANGHALDHRSDLFSLGTVLYVMCTGRPPFRAANTMAVLKRVCEETPRPIRETNPEMPEWLSDIVAKLHAKRPEERYQTAREVAELLGAKLAELQFTGRANAGRADGRNPPGDAAPATMVAPTRVAPAPAAPRPRRLVFAAVLLALVASVIAAVVYWPRDGVFVPREKKPPELKEDEWVQLFNGKDLDGWKQPDWPDPWHVVDGILVGKVEEGHSRILSTTRGDYENFHLRAEVLAEDFGNNGICFRAEPLCFRGYVAEVTGNDAGINGSLLLVHDQDVKWLRTAKSPPIGAADWNVLEIIAQGMEITTRVNGKESARITDATIARGHVSLTVGGRRPSDGVPTEGGSVIRFRKIEIKELPPNKKVEAAGPFVVLATQAQPERAFATLKDAVEKTASGDTVEIRGDGPFVTGPANLGQRALTLKAGQGFRPVIKLSPTAAQTDAPLLITKAPLVVEGIEFQRVSGKLWEDSARDNIITSYMAPLYVANCRFIQKPGWNALWVMDCPACEIRNCEFLSDKGSGIECSFPSDGRLVIENCLLTGGTGVGIHYGRHPQNVSLRLTRNTWRSFWGLLFMLDSEPKLLPNGPTTAAYRVDASGNIFETRDGALMFEQTKELLEEKKPLPAPEAGVLLKRLFAWHDRQNLYSSGQKLLMLSAKMSPLSQQADLKDLAEWERFWDLSKTGSLQGRLRYEGGDLPAKAALAAEKLTPQDFRLRPDSDGYKSGPGGKDLGADVDRVGPGPAYERWRKTPAYQEWRKQVEKM